ncbi:hypothetical protein COY52_02850 [Candidatus Desantisbacteria bacterium CG_4_10_14_0_8_um_filter_48_22]|uniref:histidine kinase n=1 Tax=Candidatus Desantisbacteria bacterium CG_4_10_14_0_8_um_filter_48_22 TaxID=1974543 RepID=A0A2M7SE64_9BACT|nr:MAG: hypothetical protein AUJ67_02305 [Candidatus Desantisbacteria bacterium CG1_02_49_89]PIV57457.1 MAG: hypothetical protein COS16_00225 [Candidatus Desantisbacteria bacterium CG02_land_8_20_14_3_00_49_13]PIZ17760.1 MAG: hypothetical protein COY52_02850 [Candidatus Desantisbacteria bacterium CG_4_10_14_0_8_um_filter_48_22]
MNLRNRIALFIILPLLILSVYQTLSSFISVKKGRYLRNSIIMPAIEKLSVSSGLQFINTELAALIRKAVIALQKGDKEGLQKLIRKSTLLRDQRQAELQKLGEVFTQSEIKLNTQLSKDLKDAISAEDTLYTAIISRMAVSVWNPDAVRKTADMIGNEVTPAEDKVSLAMAMIYEECMRSIEETKNISDKAEKNRLKVSLLTAVFSFLILCFIIIFSTLSITRPIQKLHEMADKIGKGDARVEIDAVLAKKKDEIGDLARSFEKMAVDLRTAQEELLSKEKLVAIGQFAAGIAHELRNPLATIDSSAFYLKTKLESAGEKVSQHLDRIKSSTEDAASIIQSILNLTRIEEARFERMDISLFLSGLINASKLPPSINIARNFPSEKIMVKADKGQLQIALKNIITNAAEAMDWKGSLTVDVRSLADRRIEISFTDTGSGIAPEDINRVFEPFFSTKAKGIGFGASISKMIIERHGGTIEVRSEPRRGTTVFIRLPPEYTGNGGKGNG